MRSQEKHKSAFTVVLQWYRERCASMPAWAPPGQNTPEAERSQPCRGLDAPLPPRYFFDASLLLRCMDLLEVDRSDLERDDPLLFRELQGVCALCRRKQECWQDLAHEFEDGGWNQWRLYCPNSARLAQIGARHTAAHTSHFATPRSSGLPLTS